MSLVSVITPCYNAIDTLPMAFASLLAQTYTDWEWVVVDDGSSDGSAGFVSSLDDARVRLVRFPENRGRPQARQAALEHARGDYLAMLDADDWIYPDKLRQQVEVLSADPELVAVGAGMMVVDAKGAPTGVRSFVPGLGTTVVQDRKRLGPVQLAHGPAMLRMEVARKHHFDSKMSRGEDADFIRRLVWGQKYSVINRPLYVYREEASFSVENTLRGLESGRASLKRYSGSHPLESRVRTLESWAKHVVYSVADVIGLSDRLLHNRVSGLSAEFVEEYNLACGTVNPEMREATGT